MRLKEVQFMHKKIDYEVKRFREQKMHVFKTMIANTNREQTSESIALPGILSNTC